MFMKLMRKLYQNAEQENRRVFLSLLDLDSSAKTLDLGCGDGNLTLEISKKIGTSKIYGLEIHGDSAKQCETKGIKTLQHDLNEPMPFDDESFDVVSASQVFEHLSHTDLFIREMYRILKPNGYAIISTPNLTAWHNIICIIFGWQLFGTGISDEITVGNPLQLRYMQKHSEGLGFSHSRVPTYQGLKELFQYHGFKVEKLVGVGYYPLPVKLGRALSRLDPRHALLLTMKVRKI